VHITDLQAETEEFPEGSEYARQFGMRTCLSVPLMNEGVAIGSIDLRRTEAQLFAERQVFLLQTFANQAVIAIENARLFEAEQARTRELKERTRELTERTRELQDALEYQTATSDVLSVISRSKFDLQPVLDTIAETAAQLCVADMCDIHRRAGDTYVHVASYGSTPGYAEYIKSTLGLPGHGHVAGRGSVVGRVLLEGKFVQIPDVLADPDYTLHEVQRRGNFRTLLGVPLIREEVPIGVIVLMRHSVQPFTDKQIELVTTFADQAVIAIENVRLFEEVQAKTRDLTEALEYQTAISDVLNVISRSPNELQPVLDTIVHTARLLCGAERAMLTMLRDGKYHLVAHDGNPPDVVEYLTKNPLLPDRSSATGRVALERKPVQIRNAFVDPEFGQARQTIDKTATVLGVPLLRKGEVIGVIAMWHIEVKPFTEKQIELVTTFADQAVIAINNVGLFEQVQARTKELTRSLDEVRALGEVGRIVSSTLELDKVLSTILEHACVMADSGGGAIYVFDHARSEFVLEAGRNMSDELIAAVRAHPIRLGDPLVGQCGARREAVQIEDLSKVSPHPLFEMHMNTGVRALLAVPLLHQDKLVGALVVRRKRADAFAPETISLLQSFASQSAIAIENARLFHEIEDKSRQLEIASQHKSQFVASMSHELRTPLAAMLGYAELLKEGIYGTLPDKSTPIVTRIQSNGKHLLGLINTVLDISKIEAGQFKLNLAEYTLGTVIETVRVATESLAAGKKLAFKTDVARDVPQGLGDEPRLTQVLLNLVGNAIKFTDTGEVRITAAATNGHFALAVSDTGPGIPREERDRVFEKFHQIDNSITKAKGGTGLGLAIAKQIVEMHGGRIWVESALGQGSTFRMELPVRAAVAGGAA
jgi:signal transduction histidine kinase